MQQQPLNRPAVALTVTPWLSPWEVQCTVVATHRDEAVEVVADNADNAYEDERDEEGSDLGAGGMAVGNQPRCHTGHAGAVEAIRFWMVVDLLRRLSCSLRE